MLDVKSISRRYGDLKAVDEVSFSVNSGEIVGLLGHNGAGKTTIMKMLSGYLEPDIGTIRFNNREIQLGEKSLQRSLGYLPENLPIYPELSVSEHLQYSAELKGLKGKEKIQAIREAVRETDLEGRFLSPVSTLSRGMKQRLGVAQAILGNPSLLILDEPTNGLDPAQTEAMRSLLKSIARTATVILSTHIMQEVEALCNRVLIIRQGQLAVDTTLNNLRNDHRILLETTANEKTLRAAFNAADWFVSLSKVNSSSTVTNAQAYVVEVNSDKQMLNNVERCAIYLVENKIPILSIKTDQQDLQSLFLDVSTVGKSQAVREVANAA